MSRKKWKTVCVPSFTEQSHTSQAAAYRYVHAEAAARAAGRSRITRIVVKVKEGAGPWQTFERITFAGSDESGAA